MGSRITRAAMHLSEEAVQERMRGEQRPWCRRRWEIIYQALKAPRKAEDIARTVGVSPSTIHRVIATYQHGGVAAIETPGKGGRRHQYLTLEQERVFLQPFVARVARGEMATAAEIKLAYKEETKQSVAPSTIYRLLARHGWRQHGAGSSPTQAPQGKLASGNTVSAREPKEQQSTAAKGGESVQGNTVSAREPKEQSPPKANSERSSQGYPSDPRAADPARQARGASTHHGHTGSDQCHFVCGPQRMPVAGVTA